MERVERRERPDHRNRRGAVAALVVAAMSLLAMMLWTGGESERREVELAQQAVQKTRHLASIRNHWMTARHVPREMPRQLQVGDTVQTRAREQQRFQLPDGSIVFLNEDTMLKVNTDRQISVDQGEVFVEVVPHFDEGNHREKFAVVTQDRTITALGTKFGVDTSAAETDVLVTQGRVKVSGVADVVEAGQKLKQVPNEAQGSRTESSSVVLPAERASEHLSWTRRLRPSASPVPGSRHAGGSIISVDPNGQEMQLSLRKYHIDVHIEDGFARTTIDQTYFNHTQQRLEGTFHFPLPADASLSRLAMYVGENLMEGGMAEREHARATFEKIVHKMKDPALLEWVDGSTFKMRVFPLEARQEKRIVLSYTQRLNSAYGKTAYRFPAGHSMDAVREWSTHIKIANAENTTWHSPSHRLIAKDEGSSVVLTAQENHSLMDRDVVVEINENKDGVTTRKTNTSRLGGGPKQAAPAGVSRPVTRLSETEDDRYRYLMLRYRPELPGRLKREPRHWVFLFEASADRDPLLARTQIEVIRTLLDNAEHSDTFHLVTANTKATALSRRPLPCSTGNVNKAIAHLEQTHLIGAMDVEKALRKCAELAQSDHETLIIHTGSAIPVLGHQDQGELLRLVPQDADYVGVGIGKLWSRNFMKEAASRSGGYFTQINPDEEVAWRAFELSSILNTPRLLNVEVTADGGKDTHTAPSSAESADPEFLEFAGTVVQGEEVCAVTRIEKGSDLPKSIKVSGMFNGKPWTRKLPVRDVAKKAEYLPRSWAKLRIDQLIAEGAAEHKAEIIRLSKSMYVMSPFTSLLVLENEAMYTQHNIDRGRDDHWALYDCPKKIQVVHEPLKTSTIVAAATEEKQQDKESLRWLKQSQWLQWATVPVVHGALSTPDFTRMPWGFAQDDSRVYSYYTTRGPTDFTDDVLSFIDMPTSWERERLQKTLGETFEGEEGGSNRELAAAGVVSSYNQMIEERRYNEAEILALQFGALQPESEVGEVMLRKAQVSRQLKELEVQVETRSTRGGQVASWQSLANTRRGMTATLNAPLQMIDSTVAQRIADYEMAYRMQSFGSIPAITEDRTAMEFLNTNDGLRDVQDGFFGDGDVRISEIEELETLILSGRKQDVVRVERIIDNLNANRQSVQTVRLQQSDSSNVRQALQRLLGSSMDGEIPVTTLDDEVLLSLTNTMQPLRGVVVMTDGQGPGLNLSTPLRVDINGDGLNDQWLDVARYRQSQQRSSGGWRYQPYPGRFDSGNYWTFQQQQQTQEQAFGLIPNLGPFYPYQQKVPLGWANRELLWDDGHWQLDFGESRGSIVDERGTVAKFILPDPNADPRVRSLLNDYASWQAGGQQSAQQGQQSVRYLRSAVLNLRYFGDLMAHAPGLNTSVEDVLAERSRRSSERRKIVTGQIDEAARRLIGRARAFGWEQVTFPAPEGTTPFSLLCDGEGRHRYTRTVSEGLNETVVCDGDTLRHLYPELGLGAERPFSRFHRRPIESLVPWIVPSADELTRGADVVLIDPLTIAIRPLPVADSSTSAANASENAAGKTVAADRTTVDAESDPQATDDAAPGKEETAKSREKRPIAAVETHLVFAADGRLTERRLVESKSQKVVLKIRFETDGTVRVLDESHKEIVNIALRRRSANPPQLQPELNKLVMLPMPIRSSDTVLNNLRRANSNADEKPDGDAVGDQVSLESLYESASEKQLLQLILADMAEDRGHRVVNLIHRYFVEKKDTRDGLYVLLSRFPNLLIWEEKVADSDGRRRSIDLRPSPEGSQLRQFVRQYITWQRGRANAGSQLMPLVQQAATLQRDKAKVSELKALQDKLETYRRQVTAAPLTFQGYSEFEIAGRSNTFVHRLATGCNLYHRWVTGKATKDRTKAQIRSALKTALKYVSTCHSDELGWTLLRTMQPKLQAAEQYDLLANALERFEDSPVLMLMARQERVRSLFLAEKDKEARDLYVQLLRTMIVRGSLPRIDHEIHAKFVARKPGTEQWAGLVDEIGDAFAKGKMLRSLLTLSIQLRELGDAAGAGRLLDRVLADLQAKRQPDVALLAADQLRLLKNGRANDLLDDVLEVESLRSSAQLWRFAAQVAEDLGKKQLALDRIEQAILLEFENRPDMVNVETLRSTYTSLMNRFEAVIDAAETLEADVPEDLFARIIRAADQWRSMEDDSTTCCHTTARLLRKLHRDDLAMEYLATPLVGHAGESGPWRTFAKAVAENKQVELADMAYSRAFEFEQTNPQILLDHAFMLDRNNRHADAMVLYRKVADGSWHSRFNKLQLKARDQLR